MATQNLKAPIAVPHNPTYAVTEDGLVVNTKRNRTLKPYLVGGGYQRVDLPTGRFYVHTLVADLHLGGIPDGHVVTHKDGDVSNNAVDNLKITTKSELISAAWARKRNLNG